MNRTSLVAALSGLLLLAGAGAALAQANTGRADFSRYVAIGDSLTAAFNSGGLLRDVQVNSYPAIIWREATGGNAGFEQPLVGAPGAPPLLALQSLAPLRIVPRAAQNGPPLNLTLPRPYNNLAVPGADVRDVVTTVSGGLHDLVLRGLGTQLQQAVALQPTFATVWAGNNDVLGAAVSGIVIDGVTLTSVANFEADFRAIVNTLASRGVEMAIANLPDVTAIPYVTTIPPVVVNPATQEPVLVNGQPVRLIGPNGLLTPGVDFVLLPAAAALAQGIGIPSAIPGGTNQPLPDSLVLSGAEVATIRARTAAFNGIIQSAANQAGAALIDIHSQFNEIVAGGVTIGGVTYTTDFLTGGFFSYDGVHPTPFGYAFLANRFIAAINATYGAEIPPASLFPFMFGPEAAAGSSVSPLSAAASPFGAQLSGPAVDNLFSALNVPKNAAAGAPKGKGKGNKGKGRRGRG